MLARLAADIKRQLQSPSQTEPRPKPIYSNGRKVGVITGTVLRKTVQGSKHQLRFPPAWAAGADSLQAALDVGVTDIEIIDTESSKVYRTPIARMMAKGFQVNRGHGPQIALALHLWDRPDLGEQLSFLAEQETNR